MRRQRAADVLGVSVDDLNKEAADLAFAKDTAQAIYKHLNNYFKIRSKAIENGLRIEDVFASLDLMKACKDSGLTVLQSIKKIKD